MSAPIYDCNTEGAVALSAATAKCVVGVKAHANSGLMVKDLFFGFDGVTASAVPVLVELMYATFATNSPGTASTGTTEQQRSGRVIAAGFTAGKTWTTEPTVLTLIKEWLITPNGGAVFYQFPLGDEPDCALAEGFVLRCTAPAVVNVRAGMGVSRI